MEENYSSLLADIRTSGKLEDDTAESLKAAVEEFKASR